MTANSPDDRFNPACDLEEVQSVLLAAALGGDTEIRQKLPDLRHAFQEPYRTLVAELICLQEQGGYVDRNVLGSRLDGRRLSRTDVNGRRHELSAAEAVGLFTNTLVQPGQAGAYVDILERDLSRRRQEELRSRLERTC